MKKEEMKSIRPLIVSYSYSGNTQRIAREIQTVTGGDWSEIYPWQPYPMAFPELLEQVRREIITIVDKGEYRQLMDFLGKVDRSAFITVYTVSEMFYRPKVLGRSRDERQQ